MTVTRLGGGIRSYDVAGVPVLDGYAEDEAAPGGAGQVLAPWPNRIRDGRYRFGDEWHQLPLTEPEEGNAIHGLVRWLPWDLVEQQKDAVTVKTAIRPQPGYPFSIDLVTCWSLASDGLHVRHEATGTGEQPAPFGLGVHPYLTAPESVVDECTLQVPGTCDLHVDDRGLPTGTWPVDGTQHDFREPRRIADQRLDRAFTGLQRDAAGIATVSLRGRDGGGADVWMEDVFGWVQVFTGDTLTPPRRRRAVAVEPLTCPADAFNSGNGLLVLGPGQRWQGRWGIRPRAKT